MLFLQILGIIEVYSQEFRRRLPVGRPKNPFTKYTVRLHKDKQYRYAATQEYYNDKVTGKLKHKYTFWGTVTEDLVFIPGSKYKLAAKEERDLLIFPKEWDLKNIEPITGTTASSTSSTSETETEVDQNEEVHITHDDSDKAPILDDKKETDPEISFPPVRKNGPPDPTIETDRTALDAVAYSNKLYGAVWLFEQLAIACGLTSDLYEVFQKNLVVTNEILALAFVPYISRRSYSFVYQWQKIYHTNVSYIMTSPYITDLTQSITNEHRIKLIKKRINRLPSGSFNSLDSTTRSGLGRCLADVRWGKNKENEKYPCSVEVYVYSLTNHEPVYYRSFPGGQSDVTTVRTIVDELEPMGITDIALMADRGYPSQDTIAIFYEANIPFIICAKANTKPVSDVLLDRIKYDAEGLPVNLQYIKKYDLYCGQFIVPEYTSKTPDNTKVIIKDLKVNVFLDMPNRVRELEKLKNTIIDEAKSIRKKHAKLAATQNKDDIKAVNALYHYYKFVIDETKTGGKRLIIVKKNEKIKKEKSRCGYFASIMYRVDQNAVQALETYKTRDEQEKSHELLKTLLDANTQDCSSEDGKDGRSFILFCGMILISKLRYGWKNTNLQYKYKTTSHIMGEMAPIRYLEDHNTMTTFSMNQFEICQCLGITPPRECLPVQARTILDQIAKNAAKNP